MNTLPGAVQNIFDRQGMADLRSGVRGNDEESLRQVAEQFESLFVQMMMKSMRNTLSGSSISGGAAEETYQSLADQQMSMSIGSGHSFGLADMLVRQLQGRGAAPVSQEKRDELFQAANDLRAQQQNQSLTTTSAESRSSAQPERIAANLGYGLRTPVVQPSFRVAPNGLENLPNPLSEVDVVTTKHRAAPATPNLDGLSRPARFAAELMPLAERAAAKIGVAAEVLVAQAALETGWGLHVAPNADGSSSHNLFGIKAGSDWQGPRLTTSTLEYRNNRAATEQADFRAYESFAESFEDYVDFLQTRPRYQRALTVTESPAAFTNALQTAGYATDPNYAAKIQRILGSDPIADALAVTTRA